MQTENKEAYLQTKKKKDAQTKLFKEEEAGVLKEKNCFSFCTPASSSLNNFVCASFLFFALIILRPPPHLGQGQITPFPPPVLKAPPPHLDQDKGATDAVSTKVEEQTCVNVNDGDLLDDVEVKECVALATQFDSEWGEPNPKRSRPTDVKRHVSSRILLPDNIDDKLEQLFLLNSDVIHVNRARCRMMNKLLSNVHAYERLNARYKRLGLQRETVCQSLNVSDETKELLKRHLNYEDFIKCECGRAFSRKDNLKRHQRVSCTTGARLDPPTLKKVKISTDDSPVRVPTVHCAQCSEDVARSGYQGHLRSNRHKSNACLVIDDQIEIIRSSFEKKIMSFRISPVGKHNEVKSFMEDVKNKVLKVCNKQLQTYPSLKTNFELFGMYLLEEKVEIKSFQTKYAITTLGTNLEEYVEQVVEILSRKESEFQGRDSGWVLVDLLYLECNFLQFNPIKASSYIDLPPSLKRRKAIINVDNNDQMCFGWTLASALIHPTGKPQRKESYPDILKIFNWDGIQFPVPLSSIPTFEANNPKISVNVYGIECVYKDGKQEIQVIGPLYYNFESILQPLDTAEPDPKKSFTIKTCKHTPYSFCYYIKSSYNDEWSRLETYRGENAAQIFITRLQNDIKNIYREYLLNVRPMEPLSEDELRMYDESRTCFICQNPFDNDSTNPKVKDHCHITGKYRGSAHATCNLNYKIPNFIPVVFHNLSGYDSHLFVKELGADTEDIDVIPTSTEKYITFSKRVLVDEVDLESGKKERKYMKLRFIDSFRFMPTSLDKLSTNLTSEQCAEIRKFFNDSNKFQLLRKKVCFPYSYVDCMSKLDEKDIPSHTKFYNDMTQEHISRDEYERVVRIWNVFNCKTLGDYSDLYLKTDVLLLADVFQNFRSLCMNVYGVDAAHYVTTPGLTWDAMLKFTRVKLELLTDMDMYHMIKKGIRGGVSTCIKRKSCANNEFVPGYDSNQAKVFIQYLDATNLYGNSMREYLPVDGFSWLTRADIEKFNVHDISDESDVGYILELKCQKFQ
ncbi:hypothetical protein PPYR_08140 [Photinus pyralis]|uniref:DNA-directed DNA polymerase n=1 Tax=Photinus pyralis TaxID=7054 RepID=A0A5N4AIN6_PHOPY|nr:hypothetical protein PPYR_08140 [Photinus pyralis]